MGTRYRSHSFDDVFSDTTSTWTCDRLADINLLDLPVEVLQVLVSHVLLPTPVQLDGKCGKALLTPTGRAFTQVCSLLRELSIQFLTRDVLWVHVICNTARAYRTVQWLFESSEPVPDPFRDNLPEDLPGLHLDLGRLSPKSIKEYAYVLVPFNFRWIAKFMGSLLGEGNSVKCLEMWYDLEIPQHLKELIKEQLSPLTLIFGHEFDKIADNAFVDWKVHMEHYDHTGTRPIRSAFPRVDDLMTVLSELDSLGLTAESTMLCMYYYYQRFILDRHGPNQPLFAENYSALGMGSLKEWAGTDGTLESEPYHDDHIERIRRARTLHYLEFRAVLGYIAGVKRHNWNFILHHFDWINDLETTEPDDTVWDDERFQDKFGLLDYELAQQHFIMAFLHKTRADITLHQIDTDSFPWDKQRYRQDVTLAFKRAFYAWSLDINNENYMELLNDLMVVMPRLHLQTILDDLLDEVKSDGAPQQNHFGGDPDLFLAWERAGVDMEGRVLYSMAQDIAREVDVAFDVRRGDELPRSYCPQRDWVRRISFLHVRELSISDIFAEERARVREMVESGEIQLTRTYAG